MTRRAAWVPGARVGMVSCPKGPSCCMSVSVVIVAKDEAAEIAACVASVAWAQERLVVVDTDSRDATRELAQQAGARVLETDWQGYGATKDWGFSQAAGEWILSLDADERVSQPLAEEIGRLAADDDAAAAFEIPRRLYFQGRWLRHGGCYPDWQLRLFRRGRAHYGPERVHERLQVAGEIGRLRGHLDHYSCSSLSEFLAKLEEYSSLWAEQAYARGARRRGGQALSLLSAFAGRYLLKAGFLDGSPGLTWALLGGMHSYFKHAKLAEMSRRGE